MKLVQIGILVCLLTVVGMLFQIYRQQDGNAPAPQTVSDTLLEGETEAGEPATQTEVAQSVVAPAGLKPSPIEMAPRPAAQRSSRKAAPERRPATPRAEPEPAEETHAQSVPPATSEPALPEETAREPIRIEGLAPRLSPPPPAPEPSRVTLPAGMEFVARLTHSLSTTRNYPGDTFYASLDQPLVIDDLIVAEKGARLEGRVVESERAGRVKGLSKLSVELVRLKTADGQTVDIFTNRVHRQAEGSKTDDAKKIGLGAGIGAIIGAIAGGGKGAAIGAGVGAGAGGGAVAATRGQAVEIPSETRLNFRLLEPVDLVEKL